MGILSFAVVTFGLQFFQIADGQPYPFSLHYFELIDTSMALSAAWVLKLVSDSVGGSAAAKRAVLAGGWGLVGVQLLYWSMDQRWVYMSKRWYEFVFWPF